MRKKSKISLVVLSVFLMISVVVIVSPVNASNIEQKEKTKIEKDYEKTDDFEKLISFFEEKLGVIRDICAIIGLWIGFFIGLAIAIVTLGAGIIMVPICAGIGWFIGDTIGFLLEDQLFPGF